MKTPLPPVLRAALYRRAVACAWLTVCERQHRYPHLTLESLEAAIAAELEGFYLRQHGEEKGRQIACAAGRFNGIRPPEGRAVAVLSRAGCDG